MVYKIGNIKDLEALPPMNEVIKGILYHHAKALTDAYGDQSTEKEDGGYILYAPHNSNSKDILDHFDYRRNIPEYVERHGEICIATYVTNNDYCVTIVTLADNTPTEITKEIDDIL